MATRSATNGFFMRLIGAISLDAAIYEEVEADRGATGQALTIVVMSTELSLNPRVSRTSRGA